MGLGDPFGTTYEGARQGVGKLGEAFGAIADAYSVKQAAKQKAKAEEEKLAKEQTFKMGELAQKFLYDLDLQTKKQAEKAKIDKAAAAQKQRVDLAKEGIISAEDMPPPDYAGLAAAEGKELRLASDETPEQQAQAAEKLLTAVGIKIPPKPQTFSIPGLGDFYQGTGIGKDKTGENPYNLSSEQQIQAYSLARSIAGVRGAKNLRPVIEKALSEGKTIDEVEDELRLAKQSPEFESIRPAAQQIMAGKSVNQKQSVFDDLDDLSNDPVAQKSYIKRLVLKESGVEQAKGIMGEERTVKLLNDIQEDLNQLEKAGFDTNIFSGTAQQVANKLGTITNVDAQRIAVKIQAAIQKYRLDVSGKAFSVPESKEYKEMFPNIGRTAKFNAASIKGLLEVMRGNLDNFYSISMGEENYKKLFKDSEAIKPPQPQYDRNTQKLLYSKKLNKYKVVPK